MGGDSCSKGHEFESQHHLLDGHVFTFICCKNCNVFLKRMRGRDLKKYIYDFIHFIHVTFIHKMFQSLSDNLF